MPRKSSATNKWHALHKAALVLPGAWEDHPWGEVVVKVNKKVFVFMGARLRNRPNHGQAHRVPRPRPLDPDAAPAGYGLGKSGWVFLPITPVEQDLVEEWVEESYRNVAPKKLIAELDRA